MSEKIKNIAVSACIFIGVLLIMCLAARVMQAQDKAADSAYSDALDKLSGNEGQNSDVAGTEAGSADKNESGSEAGGTEQSSGENSASGEGQSTGVSAGVEGQGAGGNSAGGSGAEAAGGEGQGVGVSGAEAAGGEGQGTSGNGQSAHTIVIDAAHQSKAMTDKEPVGPGSENTRNKITVGATGAATGTSEFNLVLDIALELRDELVKRGYSVYMIRESNDVTISDAERAQLANTNGEAVVHIHANADDREGINGTMAFYPSTSNTFVGALSADCKELSTALLNGLNAATDAKTWGTIANDNLTAINWTKIPAAHVEVGYLSNPDEDRLMQTPEYRTKIVAGLADGLDDYFAGR